MMRQFLQNVFPGRPDQTHQKEVNQCCFLLFLAKEKVFDYIKKILGRFKLKDLEEIINEFFDVSVPHLRQGILAKKLTVNSSNLTQILLARIVSRINCEMVFF